MRTISSFSTATITWRGDLTTLPPEALLREELDLDSMDFLRFVLALHDRLGIEIPEAHYPRLSTVRGTMRYLNNHLAALPPHD